MGLGRGKGGRGVEERAQTFHNFPCALFCVSVCVREKRGKGWGGLRGGKRRKKTFELVTSPLWFGKEKGKKRESRFDPFIALLALVVWSAVYGTVTFLLPQKICRNSTAHFPNARPTFYLQRSRRIKERSVFFFFLLLFYLGRPLLLYTAFPEVQNLGVYKSSQIFYILPKPKQHFVEVRSRVARFLHPLPK